MERIEEIFQESITRSKISFQNEIKSQVDLKARQLVNEICPEVDFAEPLNLEEIMEPMKEGENNDTERIKTQNILKEFEWKKLVEEKIEIVLCIHKEISFGGKITFPNSCYIENPKIDSFFLLTKTGILLNSINGCSQSQLDNTTYYQVSIKTGNYLSKCWPYNGFIVSNCKKEHSQEKKDSHFCYQCIKEYDSFSLTKQQVEMLKLKWITINSCIELINHFKTSHDFSESYKQGKSLEKVMFLEKEIKTQKRELEAKEAELHDLRETLLLEQQKHIEDINSFLSRQERERKLQTVRTIDLAEREADIEENEKKFSLFLDVERIYKTFKKIFNKLHKEGIYSEELDEIEENLYRKKKLIVVAQACSSSVCKEEAEESGEESEDEEIEIAVPQKKCKKVKCNFYRKAGSDYCNGHSK
jgi:hypothetical protein